MRKRIVAGNWKMNTILPEALALATEVSNLSQKVCECVGVYIAPPFTHLSDISKVINNKRVILTAQNCASEESGAYTGEVSVKMLKSIGVKAVIIGHSERRSYYKEDDQILNKKVKLVLANGLQPIFCCGEVLEERNSGNHFNVVKTQITAGLFDLTVEDFKKVIIAYEPVWAIGTGVTASPAQAQEMHNFIRSLLIEKYGQAVADCCTILYGGSCKASNARELFENEDVDGGLIGGAALKAEEFMGIIEACRCHPDCNCDCNKDDDDGCGCGCDCK